MTPGLDDAHAYTLGEHAAKIENIERRVESMDGKLDTLLASSEQVKGGYRALAAAGAVGGAIAAAVIKFFAGLKGGQG